MNTKVYVGDLGPHGNKDDLEHEFEQYGTLKSVWVARNPPGFAFVEFEDPRDAEEAVRDMDGKMIGGVRIRVEHAKNRQGGGRGGGDYGNRGDYRGGGRRGNSFNRYRRSPPRRRSR
jgi:arginine/serine-rich splicing factor 7